MIKFTMLLPSGVDLQMNSMGEKNVQIFYKIFANQKYKSD